MALITRSLMTLLARMPGVVSPSCSVEQWLALGWNVLNQPRRAAGQRLASASPFGADSHTGRNSSVYLAPPKNLGHDNTRSIVPRLRFPSNSPFNCVSRSS